MIYGRYLCPRCNTQTERQWFTQADMPPPVATACASCWRQAYRLSSDGRKILQPEVDPPHVRWRWVPTNSLPTPLTTLP